VLPSIYKVHRGSEQEHAVATVVNVTVLRVGAAEDLLGPLRDRSSERVREPMRTVQETGGQAVTEITRMMGLLRDRATPPCLDLHSRDRKKLVPELDDRMSTLTRWIPRPGREPGPTPVSTAHGRRRSRSRQRRVESP
jgi:hypothetical protein